MGDAREEVPVRYDGAPLTVAFNARYLVEPLEEMEAEEVQLELGAELDATVLRPVGADGYLGVVMPMRV